MDVSKCTKGPWSYEMAGDTNYARIFLHGDGEQTDKGGDSLRGYCGEANAELIAEAGTVAAETGMSPRQLAEQVEALREALADGLQLIEQGIPAPPSHLGPCGPESGCDGDCMVYYYFCRWLESARETLATTARKGGE